MKRFLIAAICLTMMVSMALATTPVNIREGRTQNRFYFSDSDTTVATREYFGYLTQEGDWYILRMITAGNIISDRYAGGSSNYGTAWTSRESLTYSRFNGQ
jgi:hypothetical protein